MKSHVHSNALVLNMYRKVSFHVSKFTIEIFVLCVLLFPQQQNPLSVMGIARQPRPLMQRPQPSSQNRPIKALPRQRGIMNHRQSPHTVFSPTLHTVHPPEAVLLPSAATSTRPCHIAPHTHTGYHMQGIQQTIFMNPYSSGQQQFTPQTQQQGPMVLPEGAIRIPSMNPY